MHPLFLSPTPFHLPSLVPHRPRPPQKCPILSRKRNTNNQNKPKSRPASPRSTPSQQPAPTYPPASAPPPASSSEPFVPRGPTLRKEYEQKGIIEPSLGPDAGILPELVANRMIRRIAIFSGIPISFLITFFAAYFILKYKYDITVIPVVVAYSTLGTIALATAGITYGIFSCSWDDQPGSLLGFQEARTNFFRAKDGLLGQRDREKREDQFERMDRQAKLEAKKEKKAKKAKKAKPSTPSPPDNNSQPPTS